jgi:hypothetical protein
MTAKKYLKAGLGLYGAGMVVGAMPTMGNPNLVAMQGNIGQGFANVSKAAPAVGTMMGVGVMLGQAKKLTSVTKKLKFK